MHASVAIIFSLALSTYAAAQDASPQWRSGNHPVFGLSAYINDGDHTMAVRCLPDKGLSAPSAALVFSPGLVKKRSESEGVYSMGFSGHPDTSSGLISLSKNGFYERIGSACDAHIDALRKANGVTFYVPREKRGQKEQVLKSLPAKGLASAIQSLVASCPAIRKDLANKCGI